MGVFNEYSVKCPHCGRLEWLRSDVIGGYEIMDLKDASPAVQQDLIGAHWCFHCGGHFEIKAWHGIEVSDE